MAPRGWQPLLLALSLASGAAGGSWLAITEIGGREPLQRCTDGSAAMRRVELVFGFSRKNRVDVSEADWAAFLAREVTPRFPEGLTVLAAHGQWQDRSGAIVREPARLVLIWARTAADLDQRIEHIRTAWKREHEQESVLRAESTDCVSF